MATDSAAALKEFLTSEICLPQDIGLLRQAYRAAKPFPHVVMDGIFSATLLERVTAEATRLKSDQWIQIHQDQLEKVQRMRSALEIGNAGRDLVTLLHSAGFLYLLSEITGIWQLLPDPYLQGGGHASMRRGDYFKIHADRNVAYDTGLTRRLAMIVFLNKDWPRDYGGELELWNEEGTRCETAIAPVFNRTVLFEVAYPNYHGVPRPLACPPDRMRHSFLVYYHTVGVGMGDKITPHTSRFAPQFYRRSKSLLRRAAEQITPPIVLNAARRIVRRG